MSKAKGGTNALERAKVYHSLVCLHKIWSAIRYVSERDKGKVYFPYDTDEKCGDLVIDVLRGKHPEQRDVPLVDVPEYAETPELQDIIVGVGTVMTVAKKLSGPDGPGGVDLTTMWRMLVCFGGHIARL